MKIKPVTRTCQAGICAEKIVGDLLGLEMLTPVRQVGISGGKSVVNGALKLREESISETMLLSVSSRFPDVVNCFTFTAPHESYKSGADWIWSFRYGKRSVAMLVQAKRTSEHSSKRLSSWKIDLPAKPKASGKTQRATLQDYAVQLGTRPMYCIFAKVARLEDCLDLTMGMSQYHGASAPYYLDNAFVSLVHARHLQEGPQPFDGSSNWSHPLANFTCCPISTVEASNLDDQINEIIAVLSDDEKEPDADETGLDDLSIEEIIGRIIDLDERRHEDDPVTIAGIAVWDLGAIE